MIISFPKKALVTDTMSSRLVSIEGPALLGLDLALAAGRHQRHGEVLGLLAGEEGGDAGVTNLLHRHGYWLGIATLLLEFPHPLRCEIINLPPLSRDSPR